MYKRSNLATVLKRVNVCGHVGLAGCSRVGFCPRVVSASTVTAVLAGANGTIAMGETPPPHYNWPDLRHWPVVGRRGQRSFGYAGLPPCVCSDRREGSVI